MTASTISTDARNLYSLIHRGGEHAYLWAIGDAEDAKGITQWFQPGATLQPFNPKTLHIYHGVHPTKANGSQYQRAKKGERDIAAINCLFTEIDDKDHGGERGAAHAHLQERVTHGEVPPATVVVDSGGGVHVYWILVHPFVLATEDDRARADGLQKRWVDYVGGDAGAKDLARVLRTPDTLNIKKKYGTPRPVEVLHADYSTLYTLEALEALLPPVPPSQPHTQRPRATNTTPTVGTPEINIDFDAVADAALCLKRLAPSRRDDYTTWIHVGMALRGLGSSVGYSLWEAWSKASPKYQPGDCAEKWSTFKPGDQCGGITLASLKHWVKDDTAADAPIAPEQVQQELLAYKAEESTRLKILKDETLGDREKVAWLAMGNFIGAQMAIQHSGSIPLSGEYVGRCMGRSASTGNRAIRTLEKHGVLICDPEPYTFPDGAEVLQMRVNLGPAWNNPELIQPAEDTKKRGGARPGAGRKAKCETCPEGTRIIRKTEVTYFCEGCGEILHEEPAKFKALAPEINIDFETGEVLDDAPEEMVATVAPGTPEINIDFGIGEQDSGTPQRKAATVRTTSFSTCNSASGDVPPGVRAGLIDGDDAYFRYLEAMAAQSAAVI